MFLNINNNNNDKDYRYKMEAVKIHKTGKGNGCHTNILNMNKIAESLNYPPYILLKFLGIHLGCIVNNKENTITGHHPTDELQNAIYIFIKNYCICTNCHIPELRPEIDNFNPKTKKKKIKIKFKCSSCGIYNTLVGSKYYNKIFNLIVDYLLKNNNNWVLNKGIVMISNDKSLQPLQDQLDNLKVKSKSESDNDSSSDSDDCLNPF